MEQMTVPAAAHNVMPQKKVTPLCRIPAPDLSVPERGSTGPRPIGDIMEPFQKLIAHPDRNRLLAAFCKKHW